MSTALNERLFRRLMEVGFNQGDVDVVDDVVAAGLVEHQRGLPPGAEGAKETIRTLHHWFSDFSLIVEDLVAEGDMIWARNRAHGVNTGSIMGFPPTGKAMEIDVIDICRFQDGKMTEHWGVPDQLGMLRQLGLLPRPEPVPAR